MAVFPCAVGSHRYAGPQTSAYLGVANGEIAARSKQRCCSKHFQELRQFLDTNLLLAAIGDTTQLEDDDVPPFCYFCKQGEAPSTLYATIYPRGEEPRQYFAAVCHRCAGEFAQKYDIPI